MVVEWLLNGYAQRHPSSPPDQPGACHDAPLSGGSHYSPTLASCPPPLHSPRARMIRCSLASADWEDGAGPVSHALALASEGRELRAAPASLGARELMGQLFGHPLLAVLRQ